jgi:hypothetical protein
MEGVIKFDLRHTPAPPLPERELREIGAWRTILRRLELVGQDPSRYDGFAFGNLSRRLPPFEAPALQRRFVITGTQTGGMEILGPEGYALVLECNPGENSVFAEGPIRPSAEALTHGTLYALDPEIRWVMHVHSPEIWRRAETLSLPCTSKDAAYGSPELAAEIGNLLADPDVFERRILVLSGHEDGIFTFGSNAEDAGLVLLRNLANALQLY